MCDDRDYGMYFEHASTIHRSRTNPNTPSQRTPTKGNCIGCNEMITPFMSLPIPSKLKENYVIGSTWNLVITSMTLAAKFNHDEYEYDKNFAKFFSAKTNQATITMLLHQYLSLIQFQLNVTTEQFNEKLD